MNYEIKQEEKRTVAGFHLVGPWEQTVKKGFEQLMMWEITKILCRRSGLLSITTIQMKHPPKNYAATPL